MSEFAEDFRQLIADYRLNTQQVRAAERQLGTNGSSSPASSLPINGDPSASHLEPIQVRPKFPSFINIIDPLQSGLICCGVDGAEDWMKHWDKYIPPSCCLATSQEAAPNERWATLFKIEPSQEIHFCPEAKVYQLGCLAALKDDEKSKFAWLADLIVFLMVMTITNTVVSLLLFGLSKTEDMPYNGDENELAMVGVSAKPRPSQPEITGIRHRPSVIAMGASKEQISSISQAVRFNLSNSPRGSISGPSKFSAAARRGSALV